MLNTPSQHRVHHGRNSYCIDKNYGGTLCIFDRLFGTFEEERDDEAVVFGVTHGLESFDPIWPNWGLSFFFFFFFFFFLLLLFIVIYCYLLLFIV